MLFPESVVSLILLLVGASGKNTIAIQKNRFLFAKSWHNVTRACAEVDAGQVIVKQDFAAGCRYTVHVRTHLRNITTYLCSVQLSLNQVHILQDGQLTVRAMAARPWKSTANTRR
jgi:hypothetical protein